MNSARAYNITKSALVKDLDFVYDEIIKAAKSGYSSIIILNNFKNINFIAKELRSKGYTVKFYKKEVIVRIENCKNIFIEW